MTEKKIKQIDLSGVFGMYEMEQAALKIIKLCERDSRSSVCVTEMETNNEKIGFAELLKNGFLVKPPPYYNGSFSPNEEFIKRVSNGNS